MATKIRLKRIGRRNKPFYRLVVMDSRKRRDGAAIEELGWYNPIDADHSYDIKDDRIIHWLAEGAIPTNAAHKLLRRSGIAHQWHLMQQGLDEAAVEKEMKKWALNREEVLQARTERVEAKTAEKAKLEEVEESSDASSEVGKADAVPKEDDPQKPAEVPQEDESDDALSPGDGPEPPETVETEQSIEEEENGNEDADESGSEENASGDDPGQESRDEDDTRLETAEEGEDEDDSKDAVAENGDFEEE